MLQEGHSELYERSHWRMGGGQRHKTSAAIGGTFTPRLNRGLPPPAVVATAESPDRLHSRTCPCPQAPCLRATAVRIHERRRSRGRSG